MIVAFLSQYTVVNGRDIEQHSHIIIRWLKLSDTETDGNAYVAIGLENETCGIKNNIIL